MPRPVRCRSVVTKWSGIRPGCNRLRNAGFSQLPVMEGETVVGRQMVWLSLTFDHRLVDGAPAARFLQRVGQLVERPHLLLS